MRNIFGPASRSDDNGSRFDVQNVRYRPKAEILTLEPAPHTRAVVAIDVTELALEIGFLAGDYAVADDEGEGCQCQQQPEAVEGNGQADEPQHHAEINGIAREAVRGGIDDGRARQAGGYIRAGPGHGHDRPGKQRQRKANTSAPSPPAGIAAGMNGKGKSQLSASPASTATAHAIGGLIMTFAVSVASDMRDY